MSDEAYATLDLSYRQFTPVTDALLIQLEKRLSFESILIFRALAEVELHEDRKFNDPSWLKHFLFDTALGLLGGGGVAGEGNRGQHEADLKLDFILDFLSTGNLGGNGSKRDDREQARNSVDPRRRSSASLNSHGFHLSTHVGVEAVTLNLRLSSPPCSGLTRGSSPSATFPFFSIESRGLRLLLEAKDEGRGLGSIPVSTCEISLEDATVLHKTRDLFPLSPSALRSGQAPVCHVLAARHSRSLAALSPPAETRFPFETSMPLQSQAQSEADPTTTLFLFSVECRPGGSNDVKTESGDAKVTLTIETAGVDLFVSPSSDVLVSALKVFSMSLNSNTLNPGSNSGSLSSNHAARGASTGTPVLNVKEALDLVTEKLGFLLHFDTGLELCVDMQFSPVHVVFSSVPVTLEDCAADGTQMQKFFRRPTSLELPSCSLNRAPVHEMERDSERGGRARVGRDALSAQHKLVCNSGRIHVTMGQNKRKGVLSPEFYCDFHAYDSHVFVIECTCPVERAGGCSCWVSLPASMEHCHLLRPVTSQMRAQLQDEIMLDVNLQEPLHAPIATLTNRLTDVTLDVSPKKIEAVLLIIDSISKGSSTQLSTSTSDWNSNCDNDHNFQDVLDVLQSSDSYSECGDGYGDDDMEDDFYSLKSSNGSGSESEEEVEEVGGRTSLESPYRQLTSVDDVRM